jgi:hypothetical protein
MDLMEDWFEEYAMVLEDKLGRPEPGVHLQKNLKNPLLDLARITAHGTERKNAPLATFIAGRYVSARIAQGTDETTALSEALASAQNILPETE